MEIREIKKNKAGFILITVLLMIVALSLIGITGMIISSNEVLIAGHINKGKEAFYIAEAGLEEVKYKILNDPMKGVATSVSSTPDNAIFDTSQSWTADALQGMHVVDVAANVYEIMNNTNVELTLSGGTPPLQGRYYIIFNIPDKGPSGASGDGSIPGKFTVPSLPAGDWSGAKLIDFAGNVFNIISNAGNTLDISGPVTNAATGSWRIVDNVGSVDMMTIGDDSYTLPGYINTYQSGWILIDSAGNKFNIDDVGGFAGSGIFLENGAGTPADGNCIVTRPGWMYDTQSPIVGNGVTSTFTKTYAIGPTTGSVNVTVERNGTTKGLYTLTSVGTIAKANKAISMALIDSGNGDAYFSSWHETTPP